MSWKCCRTCLATESLRPIFTAFESNDNFADAVCLAIGIKIEPNDTLPQLLCSKCINFINDINDFRQNAELAQKTLSERLEKKEFCDIKEEPLIVKTESIPLDDYHNDFDDDDIPLRSLQCDSNLEIKKNCTEELEDKVKDNNDLKQITLKSESRKKKLSSNNKTNGTKNTGIRKVRSKKENTAREKNVKKKNGEKEEIECEYCHKILTSKLSLRNHYKIHTGFDFVCEHCGKKFITRRLLLMHCRAKHGYEKTDKCSYCDYKASNAEQVKIHERLHTGEKPYVCNECGAGFHRKSSYLQHIAIHLPEKTVQCDQCPARFKSVTLMRIHKNRHRLPTFRFRCDLCGNTFARRRNVARHLTSVHTLSPDPKHIQRLKI